MINAQDLLSLSDLAAEEIEHLAERAIQLECDWVNRCTPRSLNGARIGSIAELPGWRNPTALSLGVAEMGGTCVTVTAGLEGAEELHDLAAYMDNWFDLLAVRTPSLEKLRRFADALACPVLNLRTNDNHPCEVLGDLAFALSVRGSWDGMTVAMVGPAANIAQSWIEAASVLPINVIQVTPAGFGFSPDTLPDRARVSSDPAVISDADMIVTDCWPSGISADAECEFQRFRITSETLDRAKSDVLFVPCPPVTRNEEVSADAMEHPRCVATRAKAYLMHAQNAYVEAALAGKSKGRC
ncbi:hypothetical protein KUV51_01470 [Tateyamaria omphalii]|uniref:ornithine carbamoyltransferase n=1 Tax=Tateyamaria omphalii TaxID=299262 RepID=UPI001C98F74D|nr:hypothetical protein [Tateyamaria omphalii]MBY5931652.1 hypothetical protein [Tateyamaria omphalii]